LLIHPSELDAVIQSAIVAYSYPYDEELRTVHLPTRIQQVRVNPTALLQKSSDTSGVNDLAAVDALISSGDGIVANISLYMSSTERSNAAIQVQGAAFMPLGGSAAEEDRSMYSQVQWILDRPDGTEASRGLWEGENQREIVRLLERIAIFYLRKFEHDVPQGHPARDVSPTKWYLNHARHVLEVVANGKQPWFEDEWQEDTLETIQRASAPYSHLPDVEIMHLVGTQMPRVFEGETTMLQEFRAGGDDVLDRYYAEGIGLRELARWVGRAVKQLTDRHPHMSILEVGAGTGGATKAIFNEIGDSFVSYTYTDISAGFFEKASDVFAQQKTKMIFKTFDVEKDPLQQGYAEGTYDLIIAFFVIHATSDMEQSLRNMRKLLKPGGFLIVGEGSETGTGAATSGFIFGTLQGWWVGTEQGRVLSPLVSPEEWSRLLRVTGFSGPDAAPPISVEDIFNVFPIVSQAVDTHVNFLREPLSVHTPLQQTDITSINRLILIGGKSSRTKRLVEGLNVILRQGYATELHQFDTITDVDFELLDSDTAVISLADLDSPVFKDITPASFNALKKIVEPGKTVLWVTSGRLCDEPYANMTVAFGRVATHEMSDLRLQQFDVADPEHTTPKTVAEAFLRFHAAHAKKDSQDTFWTIEPEIVVDEHGRQLVPRLRFIDELNDRYNAGRRDVARTTDLSTSANSIGLQPRQDSGYQLRELSPYHFQVTAEDIDRALDLRITHSLLSALKTAFGHKFLVVGLDHETETSYLALVSSLASVVRVPRDCAVEFVTTGMTASDVLAQVAAHLVSIEVMGSLHAGQAVVAHNIPRAIAAAMETQAAAAHVQITFTTDRSDGSVPESWIKLPSYIGLNDIDEILNLEDPPTVFVGLSNHTIAHSENETTLVSRFKSWCNIVLTADSLFSPISTAKRHPNDAARAALGERLRSAFAHVNQQPPLDDTEVLHLEDLVRGSPCIDPLCVVDWTCAASLPVLKSRLDIGQMFKSTGSTYWIVGMSGALGISLVDWMINKGARNVVMSSRRPDFSPDWIVAHKRKGAIVTVVPCDVTDESAIKQAHRRICDALPPIVGVVHGAMVLHDVSVRNMTFDQLQSVVRPKVDGAIYLDRIFENTNLDFFVFTSSINTVIGNLGQANYAAANAFMCSLAAQRRKRGFRAAAVNGGAIIGAGYMEREARRAWDKIAQHNYMMRLSEEDFVQSVCEGIDACRLESPYGPEISTGLNNVPFDARNQPFWASDPKFSIFIQHKQDVTDLGGQGKAAGAGGTTLLQNLEKCETQQQVYDTIKSKFCLSRMQDKVG
jgi:NAD(P)-dependent dehydrogenase (short-subunit alcohol dehydrogenase family)/SAM-dependent methyltransferase